MARVQANETFFEIFSQNASNPLHLVQSTCFGQFRTIWLPHVDRCKIRSWDAVWARVWADKILSSFSAKTHPIHYLRSKTHVLGGFAPFGGRKCTVAKSGPGMPFGHGFGPMKLFLCFPAKMDPIHYFRSNTHVLVSHHLVAASAPLRNGVLGCRLGTSSGQQNFFRDFPPKRI